MRYNKVVIFGINSCEQRLYVNNGHFVMCFSGASAVAIDNKIEQAMVSRY